MFFRSICLNFTTLLAISLLLTACLPTLPPANEERALNITQETTVEPFNQSGSWDTYAAQELTMQVREGVFRAVMALPGRYAWSVNHITHQNVIIEADVTSNAARQGIDDKAMMGVMCRTSPQNNGRAYYFLIADGAFSIRRGEQGAVAALLPWQNHRAIHNDGRENIIRAVCVDDYLAMYVNGDYLGSVQDSRYHQGFAGLVLGLPVRAGAGDFADVVFDDLRIWQAQLAQD